MPDIYSMYDSIFLFQSLDVRASEDLSASQVFQQDDQNFTSFYMFFLFNHPEAGMFQKEKDCFISDIAQAEKIQNSASTELHEWSKNMVNIESCQLKFLKENCVFLSYLSKMKIVSMFYNSSLFQQVLQLGCTIFVLEKFNFKYDKVFCQTYVLLPFPNLNDLNSCGQLASLASASYRKT